MKRAICLMLALVLIVSVSAYSFPAARASNTSSLAKFEPIDYTTGVLPMFAVRYDDGYLASIAVAKLIWQDANIWTIPYIDVGHYGSLGGEVAKIWNLSDRFSIGLTPAIGVDWIETEPADTDPLSYLTGAGGALITWRVSEKAYLAGFVKYKFDFAGSEIYQDGVQGGLAVGYWFKFPQIE